MIYSKYQHRYLLHIRLRGFEVGRLDRVMGSRNRGGKMTGDQKWIGADGGAANPG